MYEYDELRIRIRPIGAGRFFVMATGLACAAGVSVPDRNPATYGAVFQKLIEEEFGQAPRRGDAASRLRDLGREMFAALFPEAVAECLTESLKRAQGLRPPRGLRLRFDLPPELSELPLECLTAPAANPQLSLALNHNLSLVRTLPGDPPDARLPDPESLPEVIHLLIAVASPIRPDLPPIDAEPEIAALERQLFDLATRKTVLRGATRRGIQEWLAEHAGVPTAVLLLAHGAYDETREEGVVYLETDEKAADPVWAHALSGILVEARQLRLVVLNLCAGAHSAPLEPFSGLAQALIGRGVLAVVAMRAQISEAAAARFSPELLRRVSGNTTVDEAMTTARKHVADLPQTTIEWSTPALFLHEAYHQGWLYKAPEIREDDPQQPDDPLREGARALAAWRAGRDHVNRRSYLSAVRYLRSTGEWGEVLGIAHTPRPSREQRWLIDEARAELAIPRLDRCCARLAGGRDGEAAALLAELRAQEVPDAVLVPLDDEREQVRRLLGVLDAAYAAEAQEDWGTALAHYDEVLTLRPAGFCDATQRRTAAAAEVVLAKEYAAAAAHETAGDWTGAASGYQEVLRHRPAGYRDATTRLGYASGRVAEAAQRWDAATEYYLSCPGVYDAPARLALVRGRAAVDRADWVAACAAFEEAGARGLAEVDLAGAAPWAGYAVARAAEDAEDWDAAVTAYRRTDFRDSPDRLLFSTGRQAAHNDDWPAALAAFQEQHQRGGMPEPWLTRARERVYDLAASEKAWDRAASLFALLPSDYRDAALRRRYAQARAAEAAGAWLDAAGQFADLDYGDADRRAVYANGRALADQQRWDAALEQFSLLPPRLFDVRDRRWYYAGRAADARADWAGVIDGFAGLPNEYENGDVGTRRQFARAQVAAEHADWAGTLTHLADLADDDRTGGVGRLRYYARARRAECVPDWAAAMQAYAAIGEPDAEVVLAMGYARARAAEQAEEWAAAVAAFAGLPEQHADVPIRLAYARARLAEADAGLAGAGGAADAEAAAWRGAVTAYSQVPAEHADTATRTAYARTRLAIATADWTGAVEHSALANGYGDAPTLAHYAEGRLAEASGDWSRARAAYERCPGYADALARCAYVSGRQLEAGGEWAAAIDAYNRATGIDRDTASRRDRLAALCEALPWAESMAGAALVADPFLVQDPSFAYRVLRPAGITPSSSTSSVNDAAYALMEGTGISWHARVAWDQLRSPGKRLCLDAMLYEVQHPALLREQLAALPPGDASVLVERLCAALPDDAPLVVLLAAGRDPAIERWERRLRADPADTRAAHGLAVAYLCRAQELEESGAWEHAALSWELAVAYWARVLSDDEHWARWRLGRSAAYQHAVTANDTVRLRAELGQDLLDRLSRCGDRHAAAGRVRQAETYLRLGHLLEIELEGARVLKEVGGLPVAPSQPERIVVGGLSYVRLVGLESVLAGLVAELEVRARDGGEPAEPVLRRLRCGFSALAPVFTQVEHHRYEQALRLLPEAGDRTLANLPEECPSPSASADHTATCARCRDFQATNPAYAGLPHRAARLLQDEADLAVRAHLALARAALPTGPGGVAPALQHWQAAVRAADRTMAAVRTKWAIVPVALGRVEALTATDGPRQGESLDEAVELIEQVMLVLGRLGREQLLGRFADLLTDRGVWRAYGCGEYGLDPDFAAAEADLRRALTLNPEAVRIRDNLARALVFSLDYLPDRDAPGRKLAQLHEAVALLHEGLNRLPRQLRFIDTLQRALEELEELVLGKLSFAEVAELYRDQAKPGPHTDEERAAQAAEFVTEADHKLGTDDVTGALHDLIRAVRAYPPSGEVRQRLLDTILLELARIRQAEEDS